jgi:hypothetical protein
MKRVGFVLIWALALTSAGCLEVAGPVGSTALSPRGSPAGTSQSAPTAATTPSSERSPTPAVNGSSGLGTVVYILDANVWLSAPDGSGSRRLTNDGTEDDNYHDPSQADDGTIWVVKGASALHHLDRDGHGVTTPVTLPTLEHGAEGVAVSPDDRYIAYATIGTGQYVDPRFGTPTGSFLYGGTDVANPDGTSVPGAVMANLLYPSWAGATSLILSDGVDLYFDSVNGAPAKPQKWLSEQGGCLTDFDCPADEAAAASLSNPTVSDDGTVVVYGYKPYFGPAGRRISSAAGGVPGAPETRCLIESTTQFTDNGSLNKDASLYFYDDTAFDSTTFETTVGQGIWAVAVDLGAHDCGASNATLIVPRGSQPDWGPMTP